MKIIKDIVKHWTSLFKTFKPENKEQLEEINRLEEQIQALKDSEKSTKEKKEFSLRNRDFLKFRGFGMIMVFLWYILFQSLDILYLILAAYIVSIAVEAVIDIFERMKLPRWRSISLTYFLLIIFLLSWFVLIAPFILNQTSELINILIVKINNLQNAIQTRWLIEVLKSSWLLSKYLQTEVFHNFSDPTMVNQLQAQIQDSIAQLSSMRANYAQIIGNFAVNFVTGFMTTLAKWGIVVTLSILFSIEKISVMKFIATLWGEKKYKIIYIKLEKIYKKLWIWLKSRLLLSLYIWVAMYVALWIASLFGMNIDNKLSLALILWLLDIVPYIWPFVWWIPAVLAGGMWFGVIWIVVIAWIVFLINTIEANILIPVIMNKSLGINTVVIFISMILWGLIMWFMWILLAVPIAAIITLLFEKDFE